MPAPRASPSSGPLAAALLACLLAAPARGAEGQMECRVVSETPDGLYVDAGRESGLAAGCTGTVERDGAEIARVEVAAVSKSSALLRVIITRGPLKPRVGDHVRLIGAPAAETAPPPAADEKQASPTLKPAGQREDFVPLLAPPPSPAATAATAANLLSGRLSLREVYQTDSKNHLDGSLTRFGSDGSLDRMAGTPWALEWSGDLSYRSGSAWDGSRDEDTPRLDVFRLSLFRKFEEGGFLRVGRFVPAELPGVGYLDGAQAEVVAAKGLRLGGILGFKPGRLDLDPSVREPTAVAYATVEEGTRQKLYYSGTLGVLGSLFDGKPDRVAILLDQRADLGPKLSLYSTSAVDIDAGGTEVRSGPRLSRIDLYGVSPITSFLTLRAGFDHYERPDTAAERDLLPFADDRFFDRGYWRYWVGGTQYLPLALQLDEEVAFIDATGEDYTPRWRATLTRTGLPALPHGQVSATVYNLDGAGAEGYGGLLAAYIPFEDGRYSLRPALGFRYVDTDQTSERFQITDISIHGDFWISKTWSVYAGVTQSFGDSIDMTLVELGVDFRF
jgi:hypothetical protein